MKRESITKFYTCRFVTQSPESFRGRRVSLEDDGKWTKGWKRKRFYIHFIQNSTL